MKYRNCSDGGYQSSYPYNYLWADTSDTALAARFFGGQTFSFRISKENYITVDGSFTGNIRLRMVAPTGSTVVNYVLSSTNSDGTKRYSPSSQCCVGRISPKIVIRVTALVVAIRTVTVLHNY